MAKRKLYFAVACVTAVVALLLLITLCRPKVVRYEMHSVSPGETLWQICRDYNPDYDNTGEVVHELRKANNMDNSVIYVGDFIQVPIME